MGHCIQVSSRTGTYPLEQGDLSSGENRCCDSGGQSGSYTVVGTVVKRASLHNADIIEGLDLHIGDMVYVEKGGEIIPRL